MNGLNLIREMLRNGQTWEARELFLEHVAPQFQEMLEMINMLLNVSRPIPTPEEMWEVERKGLEEELEEDYKSKGA
jgi:hypothetical protein